MTDSGLSFTCSCSNKSHYNTFQTLDAELWRPRRSVLLSYPRNNEHWRETAVGGRSPLKKARFGLKFSIRTGPDRPLQDGWQIFSGEQIFSLGTKSRRGRAGVCARVTRPLPKLFPMV